MVNNNKVHLNSNLKVFNVANEADVVNVVKLNPESCTCVEKKGCAYILAWNISIGKPIKQKNKKIPNLKALKSNRQKSGRKYRKNIKSPIKKRQKKTFRN